MTTVSVPQKRELSSQARVAKIYRSYLHISNEFDCRFKTKATEFLNSLSGSTGTNVKTLAVKPRIVITEKES